MSRIATRPRHCAAGISKWRARRCHRPVAREYYQEDLIGLRVRSRAGQELGLVSHFVEAPANAVMVVMGQRELWIPAVPSHLLRVDLERGEIEVDWPVEL